MKYLIGCLVFFLTACEAAPPEQAAFQIFAIGNLERHTPYESVVGKTDIELFTAKNEWEGFSVIIKANKALHNVNVQLSNLKHSSGYQLEKHQLYRQRYVSVTKPTIYSPYPPQAYPDILLPKRETAKTIQPEFRAFPQDLKEKQNLPIWADIYIPSDAPVGEYTGNLAVFVDGEKSVRLSVKLTVWNFALPKQSPLRTVFGTNSFRVGAIYGFDPRPDQSAEKNLLIRAYNDQLLDHYLSPEDFWDATPTLDWESKKPNFSHQFEGVGNVTENARYYFKQRGASVYTYRFSSTFPFYDTYREQDKSLPYIRAYADWCHTLIGADRCYTDPSFIDEPDTPEAYEEVRKWSHYFRQVKPHSGKSINFTVSEPPFSYDEKLGSLHGDVDVWVGKFFDYWKERESLKKNTALERKAKGDELWAYTALAPDFKAYKRQFPDFDMEKGSYPPAWQIDYPAINYRLPTWLFHQYGITGLGYWSTIEWEQGLDVWRDVGSFVLKQAAPRPTLTFNGDGLLIYPGFKKTTGSDEPIPSLRLKWIRESIEDYMYIDLLYKAGEQDFVQQQIKRFARHYGDWDNNPELLMEVRQALGERLHQLSQGQQP